MGGPGINYKFVSLDRDKWDTAPGYLCRSPLEWRRDRS